MPAKNLRSMPKSPSATRRQLQLATGVLNYELVRARRRSIAIQALQEGIRVRAPRWASIADIEHFMRAQQEWIHERLAADNDHGLFSWVAGAQLPLLGRMVHLAAVAGQRHIVLQQDRLAIPAEWLAAGCRDAALKWIRARALALFRERAGVYAQQLGLPAPALRLSNARTRWGSCSHGPSGPRISLHWKLYLLPQALIDYVIAHELSHLRELNHSARFWAVVEGLYPEYRAARLELNRLGRGLPRL
jgi:predicted metal-dependent hydrolase